MSQLDEELEPVIPVEQDLVPFEQTTLLGVHLPDDRVAALFSLLCESLHLDRSGQTRRIKADPAIADCLIPARIETPGGPQVLNVLIAGAIPIWLSGIRLGKVAPELRPLLLALKREAADVLYRHFFKIGARSTPPLEAEQPQALPRSPWQMGRHFIDTLEQENLAMQQELTALRQEQQMILAEQAAIRQEQAIVREHQEAIEEEMMLLKEQLVGSAAPVRPQQPPAAASRLSTEHLVQMHLLTRSLRGGAGEPVNVVFRELAAYFGVPDVSDLPDAAWDRILTWFWQRGQTG